jgi:prepilin-type N-terminal cleavage/methylation domain-containing protein
MKAKGFTLVEMAIVMVLVGILVGIGASMIGPLTKRAKMTETKEIVNAAVESIVSFGSSSKRLPTLAEFPTKVRNPNDAWTKPLLYIFDANLTVIPGGAAEAICVRKSTGYTVCRDAACTPATNIPNVAFVVVSGAENYNIQTGTLAGGVCPAGQTCVRVYATDTPNIDNYPTDFNRPENYDDIVKWATLDELKAKVWCQGAPLKIVNNELPSGRVGTLYSASVYPDGGIPFAGVATFRWCVQSTLPAGITATPNVISANCAGLAEASWGLRASLQLSGTPTAPGSYPMTIFARDNNDATGTNDNIAQKAFVLTINP